MRVVAFIIASLVLLAAAGLSSRAGHAARGAPPLGAFLDIEGERLHYLDIGPKESARPPIILIHGASANLRDMKIALGDRLSKDRRVLMIDRPGHGYSSRPADGAQLTRQAALIKEVADSLGLQRPIVLGQSYGGAVALSFALAFQDEMSGLVLLAPVSHEWPGGVAWYNNVSGWPVAGFLLRRLIIPVYGPLTGPGSVDESFAPHPAPDNYYERAGVGLLFRPLEFQANAEDLVALKPQIIAMSDGYDALRIPVTVAAGDADKTVYPSIHAQGLARDIDHAELFIFEDTGHPLHHQRADEIVAMIDRMSEQAAAAELTTLNISR
ncbi:MAG: alpha/beta hydrolase [Pseudomonadota bacterium]